MKFLVLGLFWEAKNFFLKDFLINFFCNILSNKFPIKQPNDTSCSIHVFYKGKLQSLSKKEVYQYSIRLITIICKVSLDF